MLPEHATHIGTLHVSAAGEDALSVKLAIASLFERMDWQVPGIPPSTILMVKHFADPLPGRFSVDSLVATVNKDWEQAVKNSLHYYYQIAARPYRGRISSSCAAVVFRDKSEMLACLIRDLASGQAHHKWWWKVPLRRLGADLVTVAALLYQEVETLPAVM